MTEDQRPEALPVVARCTISGGAHGYVFEGELVQTADGRVLRRCRNDFGPPLGEVAFETVDTALDLRRELARLRAAPVLDRSGHRVARLELETGGDAIAMWYPRPLIGDSPIDHPADRLFAALWGWPTAR